MSNCITCLHLVNQNVSMITVGGTGLERLTLLPKIVQLTTLLFGNSSIGTAASFHSCERVRIRFEYAVSFRNTLMGRLVLASRAHEEPREPIVYLN